MGGIANSEVMWCTVYLHYYFLFNISTPCIISMFRLVTPLVDGQQTDPPYGGQTESCESIRTNPDRVAHNQYDVGRFRASHSKKVVTGRYLDHTISWSLFLSFVALD